MKIYLSSFPVAISSILEIDKKVFFTWKILYEFLFKNMKIDFV